MRWINSSVVVDIYRAFVPERTEEREKESGMGDAVVGVVKWFFTMAGAILGFVLAIAFVVTIVKFVWMAI